MTGQDIVGTISVKQVTFDDVSIEGPLMLKIPIQARQNSIMIDLDCQSASEIQEQLKNLLDVPIRFGKEKFLRDKKLIDAQKERVNVLRTELESARIQTNETKNALETQIQEIRTEKEKVENQKKEIENTSLENERNLRKMTKIAKFVILCKNDI